MHLEIPDYLGVSKEQARLDVASQGLLLAHCEPRAGGAAAGAGGSAASRSAPALCGHAGARAALGRARHGRSSRTSSAGAPSDPDAPGSRQRACGAAARVQASTQYWGLLTRHLDALEQEVEDKGGLRDLLANHYARVYRVASTALAA